MRKYVILTTFFSVFHLLHAVSQVKTDGSARTTSASPARVRGSIKGIVADTAGRSPMADATVSISPERDTSDIQFAITDQHIRKRNG